MAYFYTLADQHMNCALNRPLADGEAKARVAEAKALPPKIKDIDTWTATFLGALRQGVFFEHAWEKPAKAVLDYFKVDEAVWLGASCGGYLALRAAALEPRIKQVISLSATYWGLDMTLKQIPPGQDKRLVSLFKAGDRKGVEDLIAQYLDSTVCFNWCITQGMHITGAKTPFDCLTALSLHSLDGVLQNVKQDVLLTEGEDDHLFNVDWLYRIMSELVCARGPLQHACLPLAKARSSIARWATRRWHAKRLSAGCPVS